MNAFIEDRSVLTRPATPPDKVVRYGEGEQQLADVRFGKLGATTRPLFLFIHGGFWRPQFDRTHAGVMCAAVAHEGWTTTSIEYRRIPGNPSATLEDVALAVEKLPALVSHHNDRLVIAGHSAGGHLALWAAAKSASQQLIGTIALAPAADLQTAAANGIGDHAVRAFVGDSGIALKDLDPTQMSQPRSAITMIHGIQDAVVPIELSENYAKRHSAARLVRVDKCGHFALIDPLSTAWLRVLEELRRLS